MSEVIRLKNGLVATMGKNPEVIENGEVIISEGKILAVGPNGSWQGKADEELDCEGRLVMPGLINSHMHLYSTFARGMAPLGPTPKTFTDILENLWWKLDKGLNQDDIYYSALLPMIQAVRSGATTMIDHHASPHAVTGSLFTIAKAQEKIPLRLATCYEVSDRDGLDIMKEGINENVAFAKHCQATNPTMMQGLFGLHAAFTLCDSSLEQCAEAGSEVGIGYHVHCAEGQADQDYNLAHYNKRVLRRLADFGMLGSKTICAHCIHVDHEEIELLAETNSFVVHNPQSNMNNAVGAARIIQMLEHGVRVGLGSDGMSADIRQEAATISMLQRLVTKDPSVGFMESGKLLFDGNIDFSSKLFGVTLGELTPGAVADIAVFDYLPPTPLTVNNFLGHFLFGVRYITAKHTIVNGQVLLKNGHLTTIDEVEAHAKARELAKALWQRLGA